MITQRPDEPRAAYLMRVAAHHIREHAAECETMYDGTNCDGHCLAGELETEAEELDEAAIA